MPEPSSSAPARQPMVSPELWQLMAMLPPEKRPDLVWPGDHLGAAMLADPGLVTACVRSGRQPNDA